VARAIQHDHPISSRLKDGPILRLALRKHPYQPAIVHGDCRLVGERLYGGHGICGKPRSDHYEIAQIVRFRPQWADDHLGLSKQLSDLPNDDGLGRVQGQDRPM